MKYLEFSRSPFGRRRIFLISAVPVVGVILFSANGRAQETQALQESLSLKSPSGYRKLSPAGNAKILSACRHSLPEKLIEGTIQ
jgi:hypothetical protein